MRTVLTYRSTAPAFAGNLGLPVMDPETAGVVLVHLVAAGLRLAQATSTAMIGGVPEDLAMEMVANNLFCRNERADVLLARTRMLWTTYGNQIDLGKLHLRDRPLALLREATGLDLDDIAALTVAYHGYIRAHQPGQPAGVDAFAGIPIERPIIEAYLGLFASTPDELAAKLDACPGSWQMLPIQERPLLRVGDVILVLNEQYLIERATQGLYWFVHDHERDLDSKRGRPRWNNAHAAMVELRVEDQLRLQAPPLIGVAGKTFFTEEDLQPPALVSIVAPPIFAVFRVVPDEAGLDAAVAALDGVPLAPPEPADDPPHAATINVTASPADASHLLRIDCFPLPED